MTGIEIALLSILGMLVLIYAGMHVAVALATVSFVSIWALRDANIAGNMLALAFRDAISDYIFGVVPLFVLMGLLVSAAGIGRDTFAVANQIFRRVTGGLGVATVAANAVFAAITGISIASAAIFTKVAVPEMLRHGYSPRFAVGVVAGSSVLGMLIPPSLLFIIFGVLTEQSVGSLFLAGVIPGVLLALVYCVAIIVAGRFWPSWIGQIARTAGEEPPLMSGTEMLGRIAPIVILVVLVLGGIYGGFFTPTEAGAAGAAGALIIALVKRRLSLKAFWQVLVETGHTTSSICVLIIGASVYSRMLAMSGLPGWLSNAVATSGMDITGVLLAFILVLLLLGTILDSASIMLLTLPVILPVLIAANVDLIWLGVITVLGVEIGLLTPPFGIAVYVIKSTLGPQSTITLGEIFRGALPFAVLMGLVLALVFIFPQLATALI